MGLLHRLWAVVLCLGLIAGNAAICAGWAATPEARMACCANGDTCPMHKGESHSTGDHHALSQAQADACCAASESQHSGQSAPSSIPVISSAVLGGGVLLQVPVQSLVARDAWRTAAPIPTAPVPRHVLLSVFLV